MTTFFERLANSRVDKKQAAITEPTLTLKTGNKIQFTSSAVSLLKLNPEERVDVLRSIGENKFYVANSGEGKLGRKLSAKFAMTHERIFTELGGQEGITYRITDNTVENDDLTWYELELVENKQEVDNETVVSTANRLEPSQLETI